MEDFNHQEAMEEQISINIDNLWELNRLQRKSLTDDEEKSASGELWFVDDSSWTLRRIARKNSTWIWRIVVLRQWMI